jgi:DNA-binding PadR family transcriptional regulator
MLLMSLLATSGKLTGYEIAAILRAPIPLIWPVKHSQIYPALTALEEAGDLAGQWVEQQGRPNKKEYRLSTQGQARLKSWLLQPRGSLSQDEILLIAYNIALIGREAVKAALFQFRQQCDAEKRLLEERWKRAASAVPKTRLDENGAGEKLIGVRTSYELALMERDARIAWCESVVSRAERAVFAPTGAAANM